MVEQLDSLRVEHNELSVLHDSQSRELTIAKSDCTLQLSLYTMIDLILFACSVNLVNKDQLEILATLRESVNEDKSGLEGELKKLQSQLHELKEKNKMQLEQVNTLLMEKVNLQSDGMSQREKMLERERKFTYVQCLLLAFSLNVLTETLII